MTGEDLRDATMYIGQERAARKLVLDDGLAKPEEMALMLDIEVYNRLAKKYELVNKNPEEILLISKDDLETFNQIVKVLRR